jgi:hypothetical protein
VVINSDGELLLGLLLTDDVLVEKRLDFLRLGQVIGSSRGVGFGAVVLEDGIADRDALVADISPGIVTGRRDQLGYRILGLMTK